MAQPNIKTIAPIDALIGGKIDTSYSGELPYSSRLIIYLADDLSVVYDQTESSHSLSRSIPANVLTNGNRYAVTIQFFDKDGVGSVVSNKSYFLALKTPTFYIEELNRSTNIPNSEMSVTIHYEQEQDEKLNNYQFILYNVDLTVISATGISYDTERTYSFKGLENKTSYFVQAKGSTEHGVICDTGLIKIFVDFDQPSNYARIYVDSDLNGTINGYTNIISIEPDDPEPEHYIFEDGFVDLRNQFIRYSQDYVLPHEYVIALRIKNFNIGENLFELRNEDESLVIISSFIYEGQIKFKLTVKSPIYNYILYSKAFDYIEDKVFTVWIKKIENVYQLYVVEEV